MRASSFRLAGDKAILTDETLEPIDAIVSPGTDVGRHDLDYAPPAMERRRFPEDRPAA
ncbi:hypothetical protein [Streptomyces sp. DSM 110735]|uniref:hypothetical protein n=1 Tax=Streptomyces sp. DSM 110735 TaxID=2775031 RepID=UPI0018F689EB|nr:hypothetical protein [Streptomyces sp. DSM 110735]